MGNVDEFLRVDSRASTATSASRPTSGGSRTPGTSPPSATRRCGSSGAGFDSARCWLRSARAAGRPARLHRGRRVWRAPGPAARRSSGRPRGRGARGRPPAVDAGLRAAEHLGEAGRDRDRIILLPGDGSARRSSPPRAGCSRASASSNSRSSSSAEPRSMPKGTHSRKGCSRRAEGGRGPPRGRRGAEVGHHRPRRAPPRAGPARPPQGARACTRTSGRCSRSRRSSGQPVARRAIEGTDLVVVRELTGGIYFGDSGREGGRPSTPASTRWRRSSG